MKSGVALGGIQKHLLGRLAAAASEPGGALPAAPVVAKAAAPPMPRPALRRNARRSMAAPATRDNAEALRLRAGEP